MNIYLEKIKNYYHQLDPRIQKGVKWTGLAGLSGFAALISFYWMVFFGTFGTLPTSDELQHIDNSQAAEIYSADSVLLGKYFIENRTDLEINEMSTHVAHALVSTEDARFYEHNGVDYWSLIRVAFKTILLQRSSAGGGSTISQQLVKNIFPRKRYWVISLPVNKVREMIIAKRLENIYTKDTILKHYLNTVPFGGNVFGIEAATNRFFNKSAKDLKVEEAALMIGMLKATTAYNPRVNAALAKKRRNVVIQQMATFPFKGQLLSQAEADSIKQLPIVLEYTKQTHNYGLATYFREFLRLELKKWAKENKKPDGSSYNLYTDGLKIYTTINATLQDYAEEAVKSHLAEIQAKFYEHWKDKLPWGKDNGVITDAMKRSKRYIRYHANKLPEDKIKAIFSKPVPMTVFSWKGEVDTVMSPLDSLIYYNKFLNAGFMAMEAETGEVKAWVGGINYKHFKYDHVRAKRQVGSTFKPIVYASALEMGIPPCQYYHNYKVTYLDYDRWTPGNADGEYGGKYSLTGALTKSVNTVSAQVILDAGLDTVVHFAKQMGIEDELLPVPSLALGTPDISLFEMLSAYSTFPNRGERVKPVYLLRIEDGKGNVVYSFDKENKENRTEVFSKATADMMITMLRNVVNSGTGIRLRYKYKVEADMGGKTGTTQSHADGWFIGFTPKLVGGAWVGGEDRRVRFRSLSLGQGASTALPIFAKFMTNMVEKDSIAQKFKPYYDSYFYAMQDSLNWEMECEPFLEEGMMANDRFHYPSINDPNHINFPWVQQQQQQQQYVITSHSDSSYIFRYADRVIIDDYGDDAYNSFYENHDFQGSQNQSQSPEVGFLDDENVTIDNNTTTTINGVEINSSGGAAVDSITPNRGSRIEPVENNMPNTTLPMDSTNYRY